MLLIYVAMLLLFYVVFALYLPIAQALIAFSLVLIFTQLLIYKKCYFYHNNPSIPRYTYHDCEPLLKHGDVINNMYFKNGDKLNFLKFQSFNYRLSHIALVVEENNCKYVIESISGKMFDPRRVTASESFNGGKTTWVITKQPLREYLLLNYTQCIRILRHPKGKNLVIPEGILTKCKPVKTRLLPGKNVHYCALLVGRILSENKLVDESVHSFPYRPLRFIEHMRRSGFSESFFFIIN